MSHVKSVETVSAIDLVMGGADEDDSAEPAPDPEGPARPSDRRAMPTLVGSHGNRHNRASAAGRDRRLRARPASTPPVTC